MQFVCSLRLRVTLAGPVKLTGALERTILDQHASALEEESYHEVYLLAVDDVLEDARGTLMFQVNAPLCGS